MFWGGSHMMGGDSLFGSGLGILWLVNSILVTAFLVVLIRYFWKKGGDRK